MIRKTFALFSGGNDSLVSTHFAMTMKLASEVLHIKTGIGVEATGKTIESLEYSRAKTTEIMRRFNGELPMSIMKTNKKSRGAADWKGMCERSAECLPAEYR